MWNFLPTVGGGIGMLLNPAPLPWIMHCCSLKMLGVVIADDFNVTQHVQWLVTSSTQTNYILRVLRCHILDSAALQHVYCATVVACLTYVASAWRGFIKASDCLHNNSVIDHAGLVTHGISVLYLYGNVSYITIFCSLSYRTVSLSWQAVLCQHYSQLTQHWMVMGWGHVHALPFKWTIKGENCC